MKPGFSFNDAVGAPFLLLRRRPLSLCVWGLMMVAIVAASYSLMIPIFAAIPFGAADDQAAMAAYLQETTRFSASLNGMNALMYLVMLVAWTAAGRAILSPGLGDRFLFLRLGMDEVRVAVAIVAVFAGWYVALLLLVLLGVGLGLAFWQTNEVATSAALIGYGVMVFLVSIWGLVRVSLIAPATLILKRFAFAEGWAIAKGHVWKLIGLNLIVWVIYMLSAILMYAVVGGVLAAGFFGQGLAWPEAVHSLADLEHVFRPMMAPLALTAIPLALGMGWMMALYAAPGVMAARQLLDGVPAPAPIVEDAPPVDTLQSS